MEECVIAPNLGKTIIDSFTKEYIIDFSEHEKQFTLRIKLNKSKRTQILLLFSVIQTDNLFAIMRYI